MQREVIKWLQSLDLSAPIQNPKRDLATGHLAAEIVAHYSGTKYLDLQRLPNGASAATKRDVWSQVYNALQHLNCTTVTPPLIDAVLRREPNAALTVLEYMYEHFAERALPMRGLDAVGTSGNAYVQPQNAPSTAMLLKAANGAVTCGTDKTGSLRTKTLFDPLSDAVPLTRGPDGAAKQPDPASDALFSSRGDVAAPEDALEASSSSGVGTTRALQHQLALIDNSELAGGANALQAYPHYARPTASTLVHTASSTRKDIVLDRPKYTADEIQQRQHNEHIVMQHAVVQRLQEEVEEKGQKDIRNGASGAASWLCRAFSSQPTLSAAGTGSPKPKKGAATSASLTALYRGRFYRQPDTSTSTAKSAPAAGATKSKKSLRDGVAVTASKRTGKAEDLASLTTDALDHNATLSFGDGTFTSEHPGNAGGGGTGGLRSIPKVLVNVHPPSLLAAVARRSGLADLQERAAVISREHFAKHRYTLRSALSDILSDVLAAHKQLQHLFDCCVDDGSSEVLENVLGHLLAHRDEFPSPCMQACWQALNQHVEGIVATLQHRPDEYGYLMESFAFAFGKDASRVPMLHVSQDVNLTCEASDGELDIVETADSPPSGIRRSVRRSLAGGPNSGASCCSTSTTKVSSAAQGHFELPAGDLSGEGDVPPARRRQSLAETLLTATHRVTSTAAADIVSPKSAKSILASSSMRKRAVIDTRDGLALASVFGLLYRIARRLDVATAVYVLERYLIRAARPFLLRHGTVAMREAVARVASASFVCSANVEDAAGNASDRDTSAPHPTEGFTHFLESTLAEALHCSELTASLVESAGTNTAAPSTTVVDGNNRSASLGDDERPVLGSRPQMQRERAYWLIFLYAVSDFPSGEEVPGTATAAAEGPLATCVWKAAISCLSRADVDLRTIGVCLTLEYVERWLPRDGQLADPVILAASTAVQRARELISLVLLRTTPGTEQPATAWWETSVPHTWECRLVVLRLCNAILAHPLASCFEAPKERHEEEDSDSDDNENETWHTLADTAAAACLQTFREASSWQPQLALAIAGRSVNPKRAPALTEVWRRLLFCVPATLLPSQLFPCDDSPVHLRLLKPLQGAQGLKDVVVGAGLKSMQSNARSVQPPLLPSPPDRAAIAHSAPSYGTGSGAPREVWTLATAEGGEEGSRQRGTGLTGNSGVSGGATSSAAADATLHFVWGNTASLYVVNPLNQTWNTKGVVDAVLPRQPMQERDIAAASGAELTFPLLVMAAALLSPPSSPTNSANPVTSPFASGAALSADGNTFHGVEADDSAFWVAMLRRAWPLFRACGISQFSSKHPRDRASVHSLHSLHSVDPRPDSTATEAGIATIGELGINQQDLATIVLSLFLRFADEKAVSEAVETSTGDGSDLCASAIGWAESLYQEPTSPLTR